MVITLSTARSAPSRCQRHTEVDAGEHRGQQRGVIGGEELRAFQRLRPRLTRQDHYRSRPPFSHRHFQTHAWPDKAPHIRHAPFWSAQDDTACSPNRNLGCAERQRPTTAGRLTHEQCRALSLARGGVKMTSMARRLRLTAAEQFWYVLQCIAFGAGYFAKVPVKKALSELPPLPVPGYAGLRPGQDAQPPLGEPYRPAVPHDQAQSLPPGRHSARHSTRDRWS
jgi:hypothetical protein